MEISLFLPTSTETGKVGRRIILFIKRRRSKDFSHELFVFSLCHSPLEAPVIEKPNKKWKKEMGKDSQVQLKSKAFLFHFSQVVDFSFLSSRSTSESNEGRVDLYIELILLWASWEFSITLDLVAFSMIPITRNTKRGHSNEEGGTEFSQVRFEDWRTVTEVRSSKKKEINRGLWELKSV